MAIKKLAEKFIELTTDKDLYPQVANICIFSSLINGRINSGFYKSKIPAPYLTIMKSGKDAFTFLGETKMHDVAREGLEKYWQNPKLLDVRIKNVEKCIKEIDELYNIYTYDQINNTPMAELLKVAEKMLRLNQTLNSWIWVGIYFNQDFCGKVLEDNNIKISKERLSVIWQKGTESAFQSFEQSRQTMILELLKSGKQLSDLVEWAQFYFASYNDVADLKSVKAKLYEQYGTYTVKTIDGLLIKNKKELVAKVTKYKKWLQTLSPQEIKLVAYFQTIIRLRDIRKNAVSQGITMLYRVAERMFTEAKIDYSLIRYCPCDELFLGINYLKRNKQKIESRKKGFAMMFMNATDLSDQLEYGTYEKTQTRLNEYYKARYTSSNAQVNIIKGYSASRGKVRGKVKIVYNPSEATKFLKGWILVTGMTRPEFIPLMKKAAAIITNEGSITCHAAIISRELHKPCIIGTKIATQLLHDGDEVDVDADHGVVKILKQAI
jgi:phosphoenolpyruvate synthase/pyruvate phosphate dikinase